MTEDRTAFPDLVPPRKPLTKDYHRELEKDAREDAEVFPPPAVPRPELQAPSPQENVRRTPEPAGEAAIYKEHSFRWRARDLNALSADFTIFEIARWSCPAGHLGIISAIATHLGINAVLEGSDPPAVLEIALDLPWQPWIYQLFGLPFRWWLRLEATKKLDEATPITLRGPYELPGYAFPELPTWNDQRFGWHYHGPQPLRLLVPEDHTVHLFCGLEYVPESGGDVVEPEISAPTPRRSALYVDPASPGAQAAIQIVAPGFPPFDTRIQVGEVRDAAIMSEIDNNGLAIAGRLIGTLQTYRMSRNAIEASRRGL